MKNYIKLTGQQVSSLTNKFGLRVMDKMILPKAITGPYAHPMDAFMRAAIASCPPMFQDCEFTNPAHHWFEPSKTDPTFCRKCGFPCVDH